MHANCKAHLNICHMEFALYKLIIIIIIIIEHINIPNWGWWVLVMIGMCDIEGAMVSYAMYFTPKKVLTSYSNIKCNSYLHLH